MLNNTTNHLKSNKVMNLKISIFFAAIFVTNFLAIKPSFAEKNNIPSPNNHISSLDKAPIKIAQSMESRVIKLRLADAGVSVGSVLAWGFAGLIQKRSTDWVRLEIGENQVRVVHTTRTTNWLTQFSNWWDHPVRKIAFKPDSCKIENVQNQSSSDMETQLRETKRLYESKLITEREYQELRNKIINQTNTNSNQSTSTNSDCVVLGENGVLRLKPLNLLTQGEFKIEYLESGEWKYAAFRVPAKEYL